MPIVPAICPNCGGQLEVDNSHDAAVCKYCGTPFIVEKAINNYTTVNNITAETVNIINQKKEFEIWEGVLEKYKGDDMNVVVPDGVTEIGEKAFFRQNIKRVILPDGVKKIGNDAFYECKNLVEIKLPESLTEIGLEAFDGCKNLTEINLPNGITEIGSGAFDGCRSLKSVKIPERMTVIGGRVFSGCGFEKITIPDGVTRILYSAFSFCYLKEINLPKSLVAIGDRAFYQSGLTSIVIPEGVTDIGEEAFDNCSSLTEVTVPKSVQNIGRHAFGVTYSDMSFEYNEKLKNITLPVDYSPAAKFFKTQLHMMKRCSYCGGEFTGGLFKKTCVRCGRRKDY